MLDFVRRERQSEREDDDDEAKMGDDGLRFDEVLIRWRGDGVGMERKVEDEEGGMAR